MQRYELSSDLVTLTMKVILMREIELISGFSIRVCTLNYMKYDDRVVLMNDALEKFQAKVEVFSTANKKYIN